MGSLIVIVGLVYNNNNNNNYSLTIVMGIIIIIVIIVCNLCSSNNSKRRILLYLMGVLFCRRVLMRIIRSTLLRMTLTFLRWGRSLRSSRFSELL